MSRIIYYIGAGASYGRKENREIKDKGADEEHLIVHEGLPVVNEIDKCLQSFRMAVEEFSINAQETDVSSQRNKIGNSVHKEKIKRLIEDIKELHEAAKEHATIDTYAKKLYLTRQDNKLKRLKNVLTIFFVWVQLEGKPDQRYDTFLANILQSNLKIPKELSIISWNYDSQFEIAYKYYNPNDTLPIFDKNADDFFPQSKNCGKIFKINGSANFGDFNAVNGILEDAKETPIINQLIDSYSHLNSDTKALGFQFRSHLSFAWENSDKQAQMIEEIKATTTDTESVVVIGYSFPYFNREIDRFVFSNMNNLKTVYIQDPAPESVEPSLRAVLPEGKNIKIEFIRDCTQFYLPREL